MTDHFIQIIPHAGQGLWRQLKGADLSDAVERFIQSGAHVTLNDITLSIVVICDPDVEEIGYGKRRKGDRPLIALGEEFCGPMTAALGMAILAKQDTDYMRPSRRGALLGTAKGIHTNCGFSLNEPGWTLDHWRQFVLVHSDMRVIHVINRHGLVVPEDVLQLRGSQFEWPAERDGEEWGNTIIAQLSIPDQHYTLLPFHEMQWLVTGDRYKKKRCKACLQFFNITNNIKRKRAFTKHECPEAQPCRTCGIIFASAEKLATHQKNHFGVCPNGCGCVTFSEQCATEHLDSCTRRNAIGPDGEPAKVRCATCRMSHSVHDPCRTDKCPACKTGLSDAELLTHRCYVTPTRQNDHARKNLVPEEERDTDPDDCCDLSLNWAADFESCLDRIEPDDPLLQGRFKTHLDAEFLEHKPVLVQLRNLEDPGWVETLDAYDGTNVVAKLMTFLHGLHAHLKTKPKLRVWFHNGAKYDIRLIQYWLEAKMPGAIDYSKSIVEGTRPKRLMVDGFISFLDSMLHLQGPLAGLPKTLSLDMDAIGAQYGVSMTKGIWPYRFTTTESLIVHPYVGPVPAIEWYDFDRKKDEAQFRKRYEEEVRQSNGVWDQRTKLLEYLHSDTLILAQALVEYRRLMLEAGMCDPLSCVTLPACCLKSYRRKYMPLDTIPVIKCFPKAGERIPQLNEEKLIRQGLKGGKTDLRRPYACVTPGELMEGWEIIMVDFVSLYPSVMFDYPYPCGDLLYKEWKDEQPTQEWIFAHHGMINLVIEFPLDNPHPPFHPVLWTMTKTGKFGYSLLPPIDQTYTLAEVHVALEAGYVIRRVNWTLVGEYVRRDLFNSYVTQTIGGKIKASKPSPEASIDPEAYKDKLKKTCGVIIEDGVVPREWHEFNAGLRNVFKLCANSFFGKLCQNPFKDRTITATDYAEEEKIWMSGARIKGWREKAGVAIYTVEDALPTDTLVGSCVILGAYVTGHARMRLWKLMNQYGDRVLYHDTDSMIAKVGPNDPRPDMGEYLGQLSDELDGKRGVEFAAIAPKTYCLKTEDGKVVKMKAKGIPLGNDARNARIFTYDWLVGAAQRMSRGTDSEIETFNPLWIGDAQLGMQLTLEGPMKKTRASHMTLKGRLAKDGKIYPFGWERWYSDTDFVS